MHITFTSPFSVQETVERLAESLKKQEFGVLWDFDVKAKLDEKGVGLNHEFRVLEVCNPKIAKQVLSETLLAGYFLPCKMVVYQEDTKVKVGMPKPTVLMNLIDDQVAKSVAEDVESRMQAAMEEAINREE
ncbi:DUF302 domain-containing protein [Paenalkalicoccus suaedae]|uniref:DUF302 domain-containing protein n=1 Tax=Paenalkalicoccus suaedae TaxID=2592382 RepID=A0A859FHH1_9BACI|nr:DUF302 domain-containing protein [Paenalkalicoccus suaedae]QKS71626.1 DUF302 domain-containing protein [Paenalkalicoccus suaedae]